MRRNRRQCRGCLRMRGNSATRPVVPTWPAVLARSKCLLLLSSLTSFRYYLITVLSVDVGTGGDGVRELLLGAHPEELAAHRRQVSERLDERRLPRRSGSHPQDPREDRFPANLPVVDVHPGLALDAAQVLRRLVDLEVP